MIKAIVFDLDGTLYCGNKTVEGAILAVYSLINGGYRVFYLTNNSGKMRGKIVSKLQGLGFPAGLDNTYCASYAIPKYLEEKSLAPVYVVGTFDLKCEIDLHVKTGDPHDASAVVVGFDPDFNYQKISRALEAIGSGAKLIVANLDPWFPAEEGKRLPGCGAMVGAIVGATDHKPDFVVGKPNTYMPELLCREHNLLPTEICMVGDVPESDIKTAENFGCMSILFDPENAFIPLPNRVADLREIPLLLTKKENEHECA